VNGYNYRMSNILADVGRGQLRVLGHLPGISFMPEAPWGRATRWLTVLTVDPARFGATREDIRLALERENIESRPVWKPMHMQPVFAGCECVGGDVAEGLFRDGLCLPSGSAMAEGDLARVVGVIAGLAGAGPG